MPEKNIIDMELYASVGKQIKEARKAKGISLDTLSNLINGEKTKSTLKRYEDGTSRIEMDVLKNICDKIGIDYIDVINRAKEELSSINESPTSLPKQIITQIPLYSTISCGTGLFVDDQVEDYIAIPDKYIKPGRDYFANTASGDSMIGKGIKNGDVLVFEKTNIIENGEIGSFCIGESEAVCKTFRRLPSGMILLESANEKYDPIEVDVTEECFRIIGKYKFKFSIEQ